MNPAILPMLALSLERGFSVLVLTNAMQPMMRPHVQKGLMALKARFGERFAIRVSLDHYSRPVHDTERGAGSYEKTIGGLKWLAANGLRIAVAGRMQRTESEAGMRVGYAALFARLSVEIDAFDPHALLLFPEMDESLDVPEITESCWQRLGKSPESVMCATSRMVVKHKGAARPVVVACTLLPYDAQFELGATLAEASRAVALNHPHCAKFCVLGGASCSAG
jgi:hypothetical protein